MTHTPFCPELAAALKSRPPLDIDDFAEYIDRIARDEPDVSLCQVCLVAVAPGRLTCPEHREAMEGGGNEP